jgi:hypothetical protein
MSHTAVPLREAIEWWVEGRGFVLEGQHDIRVFGTCIRVCIESCICTRHRDGWGGQRKQINNFIPSLPDFVNLTCMLQKSISSSKRYTMTTDRRRGIDDNESFL